MTSIIKNNMYHKFLHLMSAALFVFSTGISHAALTDLGVAPLISSTTSDVLPNLMYILDNSGSMSWDYMPDYVNDNNKCKTTGTSGDFSAACGFGQRPGGSIYCLRRCPAVGRGAVRKAGAWH